MISARFPLVAALTAASLVIASAAPAQGASTARPFGIGARVAPQAYLNMPPHANGRIPALLSQTGAFSDVRKLAMAPGLVPYDIVLPFWSDGAQKLRWMSLPAGKIRYSATGDWVFPEGTVFVKTFEMPTDAAHPDARRRLETRLLVRDSAGGVYGVVYKWRRDGSDADLLPSKRIEPLSINTASGSVQHQNWYYPSREDCLACHNKNTSGVLGLKARQMNRDLSYPSGVTDNQIRAWNHLGFFDAEVGEAELARIATLARSDDAARSLEDRARSYLDANCSQCHRPGGTVANFDARYETPPARQQIVDGEVLINEGIDRPRIVSPHDIWRSIMYMRVNTVDDIRMPPVARETIDAQGVALLEAWIESMPGKPVLEPIRISPAGGSYAGPVEVTLSQPEPGADIRYTLDGSVPGTSDARYEKPIRLEATAVLRARAYKDGYTRSITAQQLFTVGK